MQVGAPGPQAQTLEEPVREFILLKVDGYLVDALDIGGRDDVLGGNVA